MKNNFLSIINSDIFKNTINKTSEETILYHATTWNSIESILGRIDPLATNRTQATDFGKSNFYTTNSFKAAFLCSSEYEQGSILVFKIPNNLVNTFINIFELNHIDKLNAWKQLVFKCRKQIAFGVGDRAQALNRDFIDNIDKFDYISGPILSSRNIIYSIDADYIKYQNNEIPYQYSFKSQAACNILRSYLSLIMIFEE